MNAPERQALAPQASQPQETPLNAVTMTYAQAAALALSMTMERDPAVVALGEDLGRG